MPCATPGIASTRGATRNDEVKAAARELLERALELARGGVHVYEAALGCALREALEQQWQEDLVQARRHERALRAAARRLGIDPEEEKCLRLVVRRQAAAVVQTLEEAREQAPDAEAQRLAAECVYEWESRTRFAWDLLFDLAREAQGDEGEALREACAEGPDQQDERVHRARAWTHALWMAALGRRVAVPARRARPRRGRSAALPASEIIRAEAKRP